LSHWHEICALLGKKNFMGVEQMSTRSESVTSNQTMTTPTSRMYGQPVQEPLPEDERLRGDYTRWGPIWAGFLATIGVFLILETFFFWIGALGIHGSGGAISTTNPWLTWILAVVSFYIGAMVCGFSNPLRGFGSNMINGFTIWALASALMVVASFMGAGAVFGTIGNLVGDLRSVSATSLGNGTNLQNEAGWAFLTLITTAAAASLGGMFAGVKRFMGPANNAYVVRDEPTYNRRTSGVNTTTAYDGSHN
jgi:hypothetical protein